MKKKRIPPETIQGWMRSEVVKKTQRKFVEDAVCA